MPVTAAGCRIEPPVSVPMASGASYPDTAAEEPPGMRPVSHGLCAGKYAEFSVEEPIANSSMFALPRMTMPAARIRVTMVASYGGTQPCRIFDPQVVGMPRVTITSFSASGTPASGPSRSPAARWSSTVLAAASAPSGSRCRNAPSRASTAAIRSRWAWVTSTAEVSPPATAAASSTADMVTRSRTSGLLVQDARHPEAVVLGRRRRGEHLVAGQRRADLVRAEHVGQRHRVRGRRDVRGDHLLDPGHRLQDHAELAGEHVQLLLGHRQPGQPREVRHLVTGDAAAHQPLPFCRTATGRSR